MENPISVGEHAPKTASELAAAALGLVKRNVSVVLAATAGLVLLAALAPPLLEAALDLRGSCGVAYDGTSLVVELDGWRAGAMCRQAVNTIRGTHQAWFYIGPSVCTRQWHGYTTYIHDYSSFPVIGALACASIPATSATRH